MINDNVDLAISMGASSNQSNTVQNRTTLAGSNIKIIATGLQVKTAISPPAAAKSAAPTST